VLGIELGDRALHGVDIATTEDSCETERGERVLGVEIVYRIVKESLLLSASYNVQCLIKPLMILN
jgi:hypothetical protein